MVFSVFGRPARASILWLTLLALSTAACDGGAPAAAPMDAGSADAGLTVDASAAVDAATDATPAADAAPDADGQSTTLPADQVARLEDALTRGLTASGARSAIAGVDIQGQGRWIGMRGPDATSTAMPFRIGSVTKMFVAVLTLELVDEGSLSLDDTLDTWFPDVPNAATITIREMLQHTSGIVDYMNTAGFRADFAAMPLRRFTVEDVVGYVTSSTPTSAPGGAWAYSNTNYYLLGAIVERVTHSTLADLLRTRVSEPLGLGATHYEPEEPVTGLLPGWGATSDGPGFVTNLYDPSVAGPAGGMTSDVNDLLTFLDGLDTGGLVPGSQRDAWLSMVPASNGTDYGLGVMSFPLPGHTSLGHDGSIWGYSTFVAFFPDDGIRLAVVLNSKDANVNALLVDLLGALNLL